MTVGNNPLAAACARQKFMTIGKIVALKMGMPFEAQNQVLAELMSS